MFQACQSVKNKRDLFKSVKVVLLRIDKATSYSDFGNDPERILLKLSTTRGVPSTSTNLKEALCEKIPLHHDLLRKFHRVHGYDVVSQITVNDIYRGLDGVNALIRETSEYDPQSGIKYRGLSLPELYALLPRKGSSPSPEAVFWLLLTGDVPTCAQAEALTADWTERRVRRKDWWWTDSSGELGGVVGGVLRSLPSNVPPVGRLAIALTTLDADNHIKKAIKAGVMSYSYWEHIYEDSMELLASLPAIVALASATETRRSSLALENNDWADFFLDCLHNVDDSFTESQRRGLADFLRLYISLNADDEGGIPGAHVAQIMGTSQYNASRALAAGVLAYANEPTTGTLCQYMEFLSQFQRAIGREPKNEILRNFVQSLVEKRFEFTGHKSSQFEDTRYKVLQEFVRSNVPNNPEIKLSQQISKAYTEQVKEARNKFMVAEQNTIAAPLFQFYGLRDMNYNQLLLCMSRALGIVASMIWTTALNAPVERPQAKCTHSYFSEVGGYYKGRRGKTGKHTKTK